MKNKITEKTWGYEELLVNNELYCAKYLNVNKGYHSSLHYHIKKDETFIILEGIIGLEISREISRNIFSSKYCLMRSGDTKRLKPGTVHRFTSVSDKSKILEISTHHSDEDTVRLER